MSILKSIMGISDKSNPQKALGELISRISFSNSKAIIDSKLFNVKKYDNNPQLLGAQKGPYSYFIDFALIYLERLSGYLEKQGFRICPEISQAIGTLMDSYYGRGMESGSSAFENQVYRQGFHAPGYIEKRSSDSFEEWVAYATRYLTFRRVGWETNDVVWKNGASGHLWITSECLAYGFNTLIESGYLEPPPFGKFYPFDCPLTNNDDDSW